MEAVRSRAPAAAATIRILEALAAAPGPVGLAEISAATGINKNMISRILSDLVQADWVVCGGEKGKYSLTLQLLRLGSSALSQKSLVRCADPYVRRLNEVTGECIQVAVPCDGKAVYIMQLDARNDAGVHARLGASYSLDNTAPGKVIKAFVLEDPDSEAIRRAGYAVDNQEYGPGVVCLAAPVYDYTGKAIAAVGIASLLVNYTLDELIRRFLEPLQRETDGLSAELGYRRT